MSTANLVMALLLGVGLSASTGLNTFLPLLLLAAASRFGFAGIELGQKFEWLSSDVAVLVLLIATLVEVIADKVPAVDHFLDAAGTFVRPVAGALASAAVLPDLDPGLATLLGILIGAPLSLGLHTLKAGARLGSTAATFGCANPVLSLVEDVVSLAVSLLAIFAPLAVPAVVLLVAFALWRLMRRHDRQRLKA